jgi:hypothetical protein
MAAESISEGRLLNVTREAGFCYDFFRELQYVTALYPLHQEKVTVLRKK